MDVLLSLAVVILATVAGGLIGSLLVVLTLTAGAFIAGRGLLAEWFGLEDR